MLECRVHAYSQHLRWRAIWLTEIVGLDIQDVSFYLQLLKKTISRYINTFRMLGNVDTAVIGRPYTCISMHPHEEWVVMELLLQHPEKTIEEMLDVQYQETGSYYACSLLFKTKNIMRKKFSMP